LRNLGWGSWLEVFPFETPADTSYGLLRTRLEQAGTPIAANDLLTNDQQIAAHALTLGYVIVTDNEKNSPGSRGCDCKIGCAPWKSLRKRRVTAQQELFALGSEHVWQRRFYDFNVWTTRKRIEKLRYMHRNPVAGGLVEELEQWPWSSYRSYAFGEEGSVRINQWGESKMKISTPAA
jgi:hypothetical protein